MANLNPNTVIGILHGKLGDLVFVRMKDGTINVRRPPSRKAPFTAPELASQERLKRGNRYSQRAKEEQDLRDAYHAASEQTGRRACDLAKSDIAHPPELDDVDLSAYFGRSGDTIRVRAVDDFGVSAVAITIAQLDGALIEHGPAGQASASEWIYTAQASVSPGQTVAVHVSVSDRPGNVATKTVDCAVQAKGGQE